MKKQIIKSLFIAAMAFGSTSCLFEHPELTEDGELGIDPTDVAVATDITFNLTIPPIDSEEPSFVEPSTTESYKRRVIVQALADGRKPVVKSVLMDLEDSETEVTVPMNFRLVARDYRLAVWSDYVQVAENGAVDSSFFYNADLLPNVYMSKAYRGNNPYKDAACAGTQLQLSQYSKDLNTRINVDLSLERPVGRLQLKATDTKVFLDKISAGEINGTSFAIRVSYPGYLCMGYNVEECKPRHSLMYMSYEHSFTTKNMTASEPFLLTCDYLMAESEQNTAIPMQLEILDSTKTTVLASASFTAYCRAGYCTTINYDFLTSTNDQGIVFNPDFSGSGSVVIVPRK